MTLKERIDRIIHTSEIELAGGAYKGKYELGNRKSITSFILNKLRKPYTNLSTGDKIIISRQSSEKLATHSGEVYQKTIVHIPQIIENMQFLAEMKPDKENASFDNYSYYITGINIDSESYIVLSTVGRKNQEIYYDQNIFKGTPEEVFAKAKDETNDTKYSRLNEILKNVDNNKNGDWELYQGST